MIVVLSLLVRQFSKDGILHSATKANKQMEELEGSFRLCRCNTNMSCARAGPEGLNPAKAIAGVKKMMVERVVL